MKRLALATASTYPHLEPDSHGLLSALRAHNNLIVETPIWDDPAVNWSNYDAVLIRSTWDYTEKLPVFLAWADHVGNVSQLWNPPEIIHWNCRKDYLNRFDALGFPVVPSWFGTPEALVKEFEKIRNWDHVILKPVVAAAGYGVVPLKSPTLETVLHTMATFPSMTEWMIQPFLPTILDEGELSLLFFDGQYSHAVRKFPAAGDYRVHEHFGGYTTPELVSTDLMMMASDLLKTIETPLLYARVDLMRRDDGLWALSELELIEPRFYLGVAPPAVTDNLVKIILQRIMSLAPVIA